jgi:high-affinity iron transporter
MAASFIITMREGLEAALILGLTLGVLKRTRAQGLSVWVWYGASVAVALSLAAAAGLNLMGASMEGAAEELFEGLTMLLAAGVLTWMIFWLQRQSRVYAAGIERDVRAAASHGRRWGLFGIAFFAVLREGVETALFLTAVAMTSDPGKTLLGALGGLIVAGLLGWGLYASSIRLNLRLFFQITSVLLILFAAGLVGHGVHELVEVGWIPAIIDPLWDLNPILDEGSAVGSILKALFGYNGNPTFSETIAYLGYFLLLVVSLRVFTRQPSGEA